MSIKLYMDVHVRQAVTIGLRLRGVDVLTAQEDGARRLSDALLLDRATALDRVLFSQDEDQLREAAQRQEQGISFCRDYLCPSTQGDDWAVCERLGTSCSRRCA